MGYFHALKLAFLSSLIRKYMLWDGSYHDLALNRCQLKGASPPDPHQGALPPGPPPGGAAPWTPEVTSPPLTIYPGAAPELKSCSVWYFSEKKKKKKKPVVTWEGMGHFDLPQSEALPPHTPLQEQKSAIFGFLYFTPHPDPPPPPQKIVWCSHWKISNLVFKACEKFSVKIHAILRLVLRLVKIFTWVKYKLLDKNTNWTTE